ncbi:MAG: TerB family tellurite resistance protein [Prolixibacteraceae bacterium]|nr:TerB family tellurite resistance protein [Prolixibacteraceae bacterium]
MGKFAKWIGAGVGAFAGGPIGAIFGFMIGSAIDGVSSSTSGFMGSQSARTTTGGYVMSLLVLIAAVMKADGKVLKSELDFVKKFLVHNFGEESAREALKMLQDLLKQSIPITDVCHQIQQNMNYSSRLQLLHFLFGIADADGKVDQSEFQLIDHISKSMGISQSDFDSLKAMFVKDTHSAYKILEIEPDASEEEIKSAYRRMAMKYHPDKVSYLGEEFQKAAKEKFQKVNEAYQIIKEERKIA